MSLSAKTLVPLPRPTDDVGVNFAGERIHRFGTVCLGKAILIVRLRPLVPPEVGEIFCHRFSKDTCGCRLSVYAGVSAREVIRLHSPSFKQSKLDCALDCDERGFDH